MRVPRVRFTVRRWMIVIGVIAVLLGGAIGAVRARYRWYCLHEAAKLEEGAAHSERLALRWDVCARLLRERSRRAESAQALPPSASGMPSASYWALMNDGHVRSCELCGETFTGRLPPDVEASFARRTAAIYRAMADGWHRAASRPRLSLGRPTPL